MEAASVAWHPLGWEAVGFSEIEPFPSEILKHRFPNTPNYGDITQYKQWNIEPGTINLLVGGTPCQSFSVAGLRKGMQDPRGNLALTFLGLADKIKPRWIVWENVPGVLSSNGGRDFGSFLGALVELGYGWAYRTLDAQYFGVPQRRRRVFVVACLGEWRAPAEVLLESDCVRRDFKKGRAKGQTPSADAESGVGSEGKLYDKQAIGQYGDNGVASTCAARDYKDANDLIINPIVIDRAAFNQGKNVAKPIPIQDGREMEKHQNGMGIAKEGDPAYTIDTTGGQAIAYRKSKRACSTTDNETLVEADTSNTLNNFDLGDTRTTHAVVEPTPSPLMFKIRGGVDANTGEQGGTPGKAAGKGFLGSEDKAFTIATSPDQWLAQPTQHCSEVAPTVTSSVPPYSRTGNERVEADALVAHPIISPTVTTCKGSRGGCSSEAIDEITAIHQPQQADPKIIQVSELRLQGKITEQDVCPTLKANTKSGDTEPLAFQPGNLVRKAGADPSAETFPTLTKDSGDQSPHVATTMAVRRLTPVECERLQGFPDNWSQIPWKGKPAEQCPDGPRYKACGNSMAVPVMRWIGERIQNQIDGKL
jgi:DNA-cytosine methyltransferase